MKKLYIAAIAESHEDGSLYSSILTGKSEEELVHKINAYFDEEKAEGHTVSGFPISSLSEANDMFADTYDDREYRITNTFEPI